MPTGEKWDAQEGEQRQRERAQAERRRREGEEPAREEPGVLSVVDAVRDVEFPATLREIQEKVGHRDVRPSPDVTLPLAYVLPKVREDAFSDIGQFEAAVLRHWAGIRALEAPRDDAQTMPPGVDLD